jgi:quercetin dioxygenase-like cupin family protein
MSPRYDHFLRQRRLVVGLSSSGLNGQRMVHHAERRGFRITELQIGPTQEVPWHRRTTIADTFYVLEGKIRLSVREPEEQIELRRWRAMGAGSSGSSAPGGQRW